MRQRQLSQPSVKTRNLARVTHAPVAQHKHSKVERVTVAVAIHSLHKLQPAARQAFNSDRLPRPAVVVGYASVKREI